ncbi:hypothetical protein GWK47_026433 [Chionoecetes opilio]|uniref:Uncharacterized protein n=1 Tax=Chionoecetes opilio TaxID=41210 RepID=A0A8J8WMR5_CHIOP|nr:hypothetical protein GWK47_026433 [Chionoecetes opilio]
MQAASLSGREWDADDWPALYFQGERPTRTAWDVRVPGQPRRAWRFAPISRTSQPFRTCGRRCVLAVGLACAYPLRGRLPCRSSVTTFNTIITVAFRYDNFAAGNLQRRISNPRGPVLYRPPAD